MRADLKFYLSRRLRSFEYLVLAVLLGLILFELDDPILIWAEGVYFLFFSFLLFRLLDDLGVKNIDLIDHPDRTYLIGEPYTILIKVFICLCAIYLIVAYLLYGIKATMILTTYLFVLIIIYYFFSNNRSILGILPFTKYPFLYLLVGLHVPVLSTYLSAFGVLTMILLYDSLEKQQKLYSILLVLASGFLFYFDFPFLAGFLFTILFCLLILLRPWYSVSKYFPLIYFPITVFLLKYLIRINFF